MYYSLVDDYLHLQRYPKNKSKKENEVHIYMKESLIIYKLFISKNY